MRFRKSNGAAGTENRGSDPEREKGSVEKTPCIWYRIRKTILPTTTCQCYLPTGYNEDFMAIWKQHTPYTT